MHWLKVLAIIMLAGVFTNYFPFYYYQLLNWVVAGAALTAVWQFHKQKNLPLVWLFALLAVIFNPIAPIEIQQDIWRYIDVIAMILLAIGFLAVKVPSKK